MDWPETFLAAEPLVLEAACRAKVGRVVYGSTTWVYSDCPEQEVDEETAIPAPRHLYTATKLAGETYCAGYAELYDLESTVLRFGIPYGPRARAAGVVAKFTDLSFEGKALTIAGDGSTTRSVSWHSRSAYMHRVGRYVCVTSNDAAALRFGSRNGGDPSHACSACSAICSLEGQTESTPSRKSPGIWAPCGTTESLPRKLRGETTVRW